MSFAPRHSAPARVSIDKKRSPPRASAEVVAAFDANIRSFDPTRRHSPKNFLRRRLPKSVVTPKRTRRAESTSPFMRERSPQKFLQPVSPEADKLVSEELFAPLATSSRRGQSPSASALMSQIVPVDEHDNNNANIQQEQSGTGVGGGDDSSTHLGDAAASSPQIRFEKVGSVESLHSVATAAAASNNPTRLSAERRKQQQLPEPDFFVLKRFNNRKRSRSPGGTKSPNYSALPFYSKKDVCPLWVATHAKLNETILVEAELRVRLERLELEQLRLLWKFSTSVEI